MSNVSKNEMLVGVDIGTSKVVAIVGESRGPQIEISDGLYTIIFPSVERIAKRIDYEDWTARMQLYKHMKKTGVVKALEEAGIKKGDTVKMGGIEWEWD